jgi:hypothetical protein
MTQQSLCCPYCNSTVSLASRPETGQKIRCPRCDELFSFASREESELQGGNHQLEGTSSEPLGTPPEPTTGFMSAPRRSNRAVAAVVLGVMLLMAMAGLTLAWITTQQRRERDRPTPLSVPAVTRTISIAPARLPALGYLPGDTDVMIGVHVAELMAEPATRNILTKAAAGSANLVTSNLEAWTGLELDKIDHVVLGLRAAERVVPRLTLVVQTREPYDAEEIRAALNAHRRTERKGRTLYRFAPKQTALEVTLWFAGARTLIMGIIPEDLDEVPATPATEMSAPLHRLLREQTTEGVQIWALGQAADWQKSLSLLPFAAGLSKQDRQVLSNLRTFVTSLQFDERVAWNLRLESADASATKNLDLYLREKGLAAGKPMPLLADRPETQALADELSRTLTRSRDANWLKLEAKTSLKAIGTALGIP